MTLQPQIGGNPPERALWTWLTGHLDELATANGISEAGAQALRCAVGDVILDAPHDAIEAVFSTTPRTGNLVVRFRFRDGFCRALAGAAQDRLLRHWF